MKMFASVLRNLALIAAIIEQLKGIWRELVTVMQWSMFASFINIKLGEANFLSKAR